MNSTPVPSPKLEFSKLRHAHSIAIDEENAAFCLLTWWKTGLVAQSLASSGRIASTDGAAAAVVTPSTLAPLPFTTPSHDASSLRNDTSRKRPLSGGGSSGSVVVALIEREPNDGRTENEKREQKKLLKDNG